jgi:ATP-binding cassette, subfamily B, bacterial
VLTALISFERVFEVLDADTACGTVQGTADIDVAGRVVMQDVFFRYPRGAYVPSLERLDQAPQDEAGWVLEGVSLAAEAGDMVAVVGHTGTGKTTLAMLLAGLYRATSGSITIDGADITTLTQGCLSRSIGVATQDSHFFHTTIADNLRYAKPGATNADLEQACRAAQIHEVIARLPDGYATLVGEHGYRMSGGEKQRLAIARVILQNPRIVILDEATAHLDSQTEALIQQALAEVLRGRTGFVIAHRLSTVRAAREILVMAGGRIVERGSHAGLLASPLGVYRRMLEAQEGKSSGDAAPVGEAETAARK